MQKKKLLNDRPFMFGAVAIILGILCGYYFYFDKVAYGIVTSFAFILLILVFVFLTGVVNKAKLVFALIFSFLFLLGIGSFTIRLNDYKKADLNSHYYTVNAKVESVSETDYGLKAVLSNSKVSGDIDGELQYKIRLIVYGTCDLDIGDNITFYAKLIDNPIIYEDKLSAYNIADKIKYTATINAEEITINSSNKTIYQATHVFIRDVLKSGLGEKEWPIGYALLLGNTDEIDYDVLNSYRNGGVAHIFAVSGLHIGFVAGILSFVLKKLKTNRLLKAILITLTLLFYSGVCGFSASSLRATVMSAVLLFSALKGSRYDGLSSVSLAGIIILIFSPIQLFCVGFQLSFAVVLGILLLSKPLANVFRFLPRKIALSISTVISAQLFSMPICVQAFEQFSTISVLANLVFIPFVSVIFTLTICTTLISGVFGFSKVFLFPSNIAFKFINQVISFLDLQIFVISLVSLGVLCLLYYSGMVIASGLINLKKLSKIALSTVLIFGCLVGCFVVNATEKSVVNIYVVGSKTLCTTIIDGEKENVMIVSSSENTISLGRLNKIKQDKGIETIDNLIFNSNSCSDMQVFITKLNTIFNVKKVAYYGERDEMLEQVISDSFDVEICSFTDSYEIGEEFDCRYKNQGYVLEFNVKNKSFAVFSKLSLNNPQYFGLNGNYSLIVGVNYTEQIYSLNEFDEFVSYRDSALYKSAESNGTASFSIK